MKKLLIMLAALAAVTGCSMPETRVQAIDTRPSLAVVGAPEDAALYVDGLHVGSAARFNGDPSVLKVEPGTHVVVIRRGDAELHRQTVFVDSELKTIRIGGGR